jgi:hypothetical protein
VKKYFDNIWIRYLVLLIVTIALGFFINGFLYTPIPTLAKEDAWLGFYGSIIGAAIAGIVTLWGIEYTIKSTMLNVKPAIRPIRTKFFLYQKNGIGLFASNKPIRILVEEYEKSQKIQFNSMDTIDLSYIIIKLIEEYKDREIVGAFEAIDVGTLYRQIKDLCALKTYNDSIDMLSTELPNIYEKGVGEKICEKIFENWHDENAFRSMCEARDKWSVYYSIYNIGAGNASDIRIEWDFNNNLHMSLCKKLGFDKEDYDNMNNSFSFDNIEVGEADVMLNTSGDNKIEVAVPIEVISFIKYLYKKSLKNISEEKYMENNALIGENQIAELKISCVDIHGKAHSDRYKVMFSISNTLQNPYDSVEEYFYFKFNKIS